MSLDATLTMLIAEATPAVQVALREIARRAYETGYREALASAHRAGAPVAPLRAARTMIAEAPPQSLPGALPAVVQAPGPAPIDYARLPASPAEPQPPWMPQPILPSPAPIEGRSPDSTTMPWAAESLHLARHPHVAALPSSPAIHEAPAPVLGWAVPSMPRSGEDDVEEEDEPASLIPKVYFDQLVGDDEDGEAESPAARVDEDDLDLDEEEQGAGEQVSEAGTGSDRDQLLEAAERVVKAGTGLASSEVARALGVSRPRASALLKELKLAGRIHQGGDRRFARYAGDWATAREASFTARKTAKGPLRAEEEVVLDEDQVAPTETSEKASPGRARRVLEITPVRPTLTIGALRARIVKQLALERYAIDVVICKRGDAKRRQIRSDVALRRYLVEE